MRAFRPAVLVLTCATLALAGCGSSKLLDGSSAQDLQASLTAIRSAAQSGQCSEATSAANQGLQRIGELPSSVDPALKRRLRKGFQELKAKVPQDCTETDTTPTDTTPTDTTPTDTTPTEPTPTDTTTTPDTTTSPDTTTTPPTDTNSGGTDGGGTTTGGGDNGSNGGGDGSGTSGGTPPSGGVDGPSSTPRSLEGLKDAGRRSLDEIRRAARRARDEALKAAEDAIR